MLCTCYLHEHQTSEYIWVISAIEIVCAWQFTHINASRLWSQEIHTTTQFKWWNDSNKQA